MKHCLLSSLDGRTFEKDALWFALSQLFLKSKAILKLLFRLHPTFFLSLSSLDLKFIIWISIRNNLEIYLIRRLRKHCLKCFLYLVFAVFFSCDHRNSVPRPLATPNSKQLIARNSLCVSHSIVRLNHHHHHQHLIVFWLSFRLVHSSLRNRIISLFFFAHHNSMPSLANVK